MYLFNVYFICFNVQFFNEYFNVLKILYNYTSLVIWEIQEHLTTYKIALAIEAETRFSTLF